VSADILVTTFDKNFIYPLIALFLLASIRPVCMNMHNIVFAEGRVSGRAAEAAGRGYIYRRGVLSG
jgi:hypothetical protein